MLSWVLLVVAFIALPIVLRLFASDEPRSDDPPDTTDEEGELLPLAA